MVSTVGRSEEVASRLWSSWESGDDEESKQTGCTTGCSGQMLKSKMQEAEDIAILCCDPDARVETASMALWELLMSGKV